MCNCKEGKKESIISTYPKDGHSECDVVSEESVKADFKTTKGTPILQAPDGGWFRPTENPFGHGCCDCGLFHQVGYSFVDGEDNEVPLPEGIGLVLNFSRDDKETANIRLQKEFKQKEEFTSDNLVALQVMAFLKGNVPEESIAATDFAGVSITQLDRDSLLRLVALLAAQKKAENRIIRV